MVEDLFGGLGDLIVVDTESDLHAIGIASAMMSTHYELQNRMIAWLEARGMAPEAAAAYVRSMFEGLAAVAIETGRAGEAVVPAHHETKGGLNEYGRLHLTGIGWFDEIARALDGIAAHAEKLTAPKPAPKPDAKPA
ncbi:hypothetical protein [Methylobrevis pamukkalensis]|uniref:Pyrroline-5-carboxylate reductase n=1 Tax=Methylobrevis pamukkalensis TaxID=1439726 RepID=A0A1E3GYG2_9HYPH|nr:hypothetical protein [Methylobrevis pamukkalensis]ODN68371.1 pyrroline-5-carboxylate reductase [Methylobrevis pamukkalensis]